MQVPFEVNNQLDLLLVFAPRSALNQPPLGIACLKSFLESRGFTVACRDLSAELFLESNGEVPDYYWDDSLWYGDPAHGIDHDALHRALERWAEELIRSRPRWLGFSIMVGNTRASYALARLVRSYDPSIPIVFGGPDCVLNGPNILREGLADYVVAGDGEAALLKLLESPQGTVMFGVDGLLSRAAPRSTGLAMWSDLDALPAPDFADFPLQRYFGFQPASARELPIYRSKGCIFSCTFCSRTLHDEGYRMRSSARFAAEMSHLARTYGANAFYFIDSLINPTRRSMLDLADALERAGATYAWRANASLSHFMDREVLQRARESGCDRLSYGLETGSSTVRRSMRKSGDIAAIEGIIRQTRDVGITVSVWLMVGYPTEGEREYRDTVDFITRNAGYIDTVQISSCSIIPGTELALHPGRYGITRFGIGQDWESSCSTPAIRARRQVQLEDLTQSLGLTGTRAL